MVVTRFAPSPTGFLHLGHAYSALVNFEQAWISGGSFLLRIEDIDRTRCRPEYEAAIYEDLTWLGLRWEEPVLRQSERFSLYEATLTRLQERGLIYRCFKTRKDIESALSAPHGVQDDSPTGVFRGAAVATAEENAFLLEGRPYAWRLSLDAAETVLGPAFAALSFREEIEFGFEDRPARPERFGDVVLGRKDSGTSYHLASVLDDAAQGVTHVIRSEDLREAAGLHALLHALLDLKPPIYRHHRLILNGAGQRLAKRDRAETLRSLREAGVTPAEIRAKLAPLTF